MNNHIYISKSVNIGDAQFIRIKNFLHEKKLNYRYWQGEPYIASFVDQVIRSSTAVVIVLDENNISCKIGKGSFTELAFARNNNIDVFIMYRRKTDNSYNFYLLKSAGIINAKDWNNYAEINFGNNVTSYFISKYSSDPIKEIAEEIPLPKLESISLNNMDLLLLVQ